MKEKIYVGILFGGKSAEHEVSLQSAKNVYDAINRDKYIPVLIGITKKGEWTKCDVKKFLKNVDNPMTIKLVDSGDKVALIPGCQGKLYNLSKNKFEEKLDVVYPLLHGPNGEDGTVQGLLKLADVPFVGAGVLGSAVGMDKDAMKRMLRDAGIPIGKFISLKMSDKLPSYNSITKKVGEPFFVKPANMGSSIGVSKVSSNSEYQKAVKEAFKHDYKIIIEEYIIGRELECSVIGNDNPIASAVGEVIPTKDFYSYDAKYIDDDGAILKIPADLPEKIVKEVQKIAVATFKALYCSGLGRVDCFLQKDGKILVNEINTIPGFTKISMYPKLWAVNGIRYPELIDRLIAYALANK